MAAAPTALIFATARRVIRPRNFLPTVKLTVVALLLSLVLGVVLDVEISGGFSAGVLYIAFTSPLIALLMVGLWYLFARRIARKAQASRDNGTV